MLGAMETLFLPFLPKQRHFCIKKPFAFFSILVLNLPHHSNATASPSSSQKGISDDL